MLHIVLVGNAFPGTIRWRRSRIIRNIPRSVYNGLVVYNSSGRLDRGDPVVLDSRPGSLGNEHHHLPVKLGSMKLHCLGTAGYHPVQSRHTSCYLLPEIPIALDAGTGFFRVGPLLHHDSLHILLSHAHLDHVVGLTFVYSLMRQMPLNNIHVYGQAKVIKAIRSHLFHEQLFPLIPPIQWHSLEKLGRHFGIPCQSSLGPVEARVGWFPLEHPGGSTGYQIYLPNLSLAYITDTTCHPDSPYWEQIQGVDWLLHECNFLDAHQTFAEHTGHSWYSAVLQAASKWRVNNLVLTHFDPNLTDPETLSELVRDSSANRDFSQAGQAALPKRIFMATDELILDLESL